MTVRTDHQSWLERIEKFAPTVASWRERSRSVPAIEPGSPFVGDEKYGLKISNSSWYSIVVSTEHVGFTMDTLRATSTMYPTAYITVLRTAYIAAVNAVWMLAPTDRHTRMERAFKFQANDLNEHIKYTRQLGTSGEFPEALQRSLAALGTQRDTLRGIAEKLDIATDVSKINFKQTEAVDWVATHFNKDDPLLISAHNSLWRSGSAAAHAQPYFGLTRVNKNDIIPDGTGGGEARLRGDLTTDVGPALGGVVVVLGKAFELYDQRRRSFLNP